MKARAKNFVIAILFLLIAIPPFFSGGNNIYIEEVVLLLNGFFILTYLYLPGQDKILQNGQKFNWPLFFLLLFAASTLAAAIFSVSPYNSLVFCFKNLNYIVLFFLLAKIKFTIGEKNIILKFFLAIVLILCLIGLYFYLTGDYDRLTSTYYWPNPFAGLLLYALPVSLFFLFSSHKNSLTSIFSILVLTAFILTGSRGAQLSFLIVLLPYLAVKLKNYRQSFFNILTVLLISLILAFLFISAKDTGGLFIDHVKNSGTSLDASTNIKLNYWQGAWKIFKSHPFLGSGPATFGLVYPQYQPNPQSSGKYVHNWYLEILAENGILPLLFFLGFIISSIIVNWKKIRKDDLKLAILAGIIAALIHNFIDLDWHFDYNYLVFWLLSGLLCNQSDISRVDDRTAPDKIIKILTKTGATLLVIIIFSKSIITLMASYNFRQGMEFQNKGDLQTAENYFSKAIIFNPNSDYMRQLGIVYYSEARLRQGNQTIMAAKALGLANKSISHDPINPLNYELRGRIYALIGDKKNAIEDFSNLIRFDKYNHPIYYGYLSQMLLAEGRCKEGGQLLNKILNYYNEDVIANKRMYIMASQNNSARIDVEITEVKKIQSEISRKCKDKSA